MQISEILTNRSHLVELKLAIGFFQKIKHAFPWASKSSQVSNIIYHSNHPMKMLQLLESVSRYWWQMWVTKIVQPNLSPYVTNMETLPKICLRSSRIIDFTGTIVTSIIPKCEVLKSWLCLCLISSYNSKGAIVWSGLPESIPKQPNFFAALVLDNPGW